MGSVNNTRCCLTLILLLLVYTESVAVQPDNHVDPELGNKLQEVIDQERVRQDFKGISAAVLLPGQGIWTGVSGISGQSASDSITEDTRFAVASITKTFIAALVLMLAEEGTLSMSDSLHNWLGEYRYVDPDITVRQLLGHKSGIYNFTNNEAFWDAMWADSQRSWSAEEVIENFVERSVFTPGSRFEYSNTNYLMLGLIIEAATSSSVTSELRDLLFDPLGLSNTFFTPGEQITGVIANNWSDTNRDGVAENLTAQTGTSLYTMVGTAGGMASTAEDMVLWADMLYGGKLLAKESLTEIVDFVRFSNSSPWIGYGLGTMLFDFEGEELWGHTGLLPGFRSILAYSPQTQISICVLVNQDDLGSVYTIAPLLFKEAASVLPTSKQQEKQPVNEYVLYNGFPNPFRNQVTIPFELSTSEHVIIEVFDVYGRKVATLGDRYYAPGRQQVIWEPRSASSGTYVYRFKAGSSFSTGTLTLLKH